MLSATAAIARLANQLSSAAVVADARLDSSLLADVPLDRVPLHAELGAAALTAIKSNPPGWNKVVSVFAPSDRIALIRLVP